MKKAFLGLILTVFLIPSLVSAQGTVIETINARILPSIWFSALSTEDGKSIEVHGGIHNNSGINFTGTAFLYVDEVLIGQKDFSSAADSLQDVFIVWKATSGQHVFQIKIKASLPADKDLISYKSNLSYMSVSNNLTFEGVKDGVTKTAASITSQAIEKIDEVAATLVEKLEASKKPIIAEDTKQNSEEKPSIISSLLKSNQVAAVFNTGIDVLAFLINQWKWTLSALALLGIFIFLKSKAVF